MPAPAAALSRKLAHTVCGLRTLLPGSTKCCRNSITTRAAAPSKHSALLAGQAACKAFAVRPGKALVRGAPSKMDGVFTRLASGGGGGNSNGGKPRATGGSGGSGDSAGGPWDWYLRMLAEHPLLTKSVTCALLNALGDLLSQILIEKQEEVNWHRTLTFTGLGLALVGPTLHFWYTALNRMVPPTGTQSAIISLILDQFAFAPLFLPTFIAVLFTIEGKTHEIKAKLEQDWFSTVKANWILWIPAQFFNFRFVPPNLQVLTANVVALAWNVYMSFVSHKAVEAKA